MPRSDAPSPVTARVVFRKLPLDERIARREPPVMVSLEPERIIDPRAQRRRAAARDRVLCRTKKLGVDEH
jgi:hypothetical protein